MGWPLANLIFELWPKDELPDFGTPVGKMLIFLWIMRQEREFLAHRSLIQAIIAGDKDPKAVKATFQDALNAFNPYLEDHKKDQEIKAKQRLLKEINKSGLLTINPTGQWIGGRSKLQLAKQLREQFNPSKKNENNQLEQVDNQFIKRRNR